MLQEELQERRQQVSSLQEISAQLLLDAAADDGVEAQEKVHVISNRLQLLLRRIHAELQRLVRNGRRDGSSAAAQVQPVRLSVSGSGLQPVRSSWEQGRGQQHAAAGGSCCSSQKVNSATLLL